MIAIETGMRQSEILSLRKSNVDLKRRVVRLTDTKNDASRTVPLTRVATDTIQKAMDNPVRPSGLDLIFFGEPGKDGKRSPYQFKKIWGDIKTDLGFLDLHFHDLRHEAVKRNCNNNESEIKNACILMRTRPSGLLYY